METNSTNDTQRTHSNRPVRLSLAMIVKNEEARLGHCLASVKDLVDEIVVLDTGSRDGTVALAKSFGARVEPFEWVGDFSAARNASLSFCTGDWILVLDADEAIDAKDHALIRKAIQDPQAQAYILTLRDYFASGAFIGINGAVQPNDGKYTEGSEYSHQYDYQAVRLFRAQGEPVFRGRVHELAEQYFQERNLPIQVLDAVIHHYGKTDPERERAKQQEYTRMAIREAKGNPSDPFAHYNVVQQALLVDDWSAVLSAGEAFLALESKVPMMIYLGMAKALVNLGRPEESLKYLEVMLRQKPNHAVALEAKGESLWRLGRIAEAQDCFLKAIDCEPSFSLSFLHLARMLDELNLAEDARRVLEAGLDQNPKDEVLWGELVGLSARHKDARVAADAWDALSAVPRGGQGLWHQLVVCTLLDKAAKEDAARVMDLGLKAFPGHSELQALKAKAGL